MNLSVISYSFAALLYLILLILLLTSWRGRLQGALMVVAVVITAFWAISAALLEINLYVKLIYHSLETLRSAAWFAFLIHLLRPLKESHTSYSNTLRFIIPGVSIYVVLVLGLDFLPIFYSTLPHNLNLSITGHIGLAIIGLVLIEQLFRNTRPEQRWAIKYLFIGIGGIFAYDFFLYSDALLFKRIDPDLWTARGFISALIVPLLAVTASRNPSWSLNIFVSRKIVFHSVTVFGAGLYLLVMSAVGYYIKFYGGDWGTAAQFIFLFLSLLLLAALLFSGQMRARLKLFLNKHFYKNKYEYREEWLRLLKAISEKQPDTGLHETSIRAMANIVDSPGGQLWLIRDAQRYVCVEACSMGRADEIESRHSSLIRFLEQKDYVINLLEYDSEPEQYTGLALPQWIEKSHRAWLIVPLRHHDELFGFMVLANPRVPRQINWEDWDFLKAVGQQLASYLSLFEASEALAEARQFDAFNRLSAYVVHDIKNMVAQLELMVRNAAKHGDNPAFIKDAFGTVENTVNKMKRLLDHLRKERNDIADSSRTARHVDLSALLKQVIEQRKPYQPSPTLEIHSEFTPKIIADRDRMASVMEHLVQNAQEATPEMGHVKVRLRSDGNETQIEIEDNGFGMDKRFIRERLFKPFETTKGNAGMGIGVYESREFVRALGGVIDVASQPGKGTKFTITLPVPDRNTDLGDKKIEQSSSHSKT